MNSTKFVLGVIAIIAILGVAAAILRVDRSQSGDERLLLTATSTIDMNQDLQTETLQSGNGEVATAGDKVTVHYRGTLENGQVFDESYGRGEPFTFDLGAGQVIPGWEQGVAGMQVGEKRRLVIPGSLAYGERGVPGSSIGPNATLIFEVELLAIEK